MSVPRRLRSVSDWEYELRASSAAVLELERLLGKATEVAARARARFEVAQEKATVRASKLHRLTEHLAGIRGHIARAQKLGATFYRVVKGPGGYEYLEFYDIDGKKLTLSNIDGKKLAPSGDLKARQWKCDNCGAWVTDDGSGNDHEGYTCAFCGSCMYPEELARLALEGDAEAKMTWREI